MPRAPKQSARRPALTKRRLDELVEEAIVDAYGESEQRIAFLTMLEEHLPCPFETDMLGTGARVESIDLNDAEEIIAICRRGRERQRIPILDLPLPSPLRRVGNGSPRTVTGCAGVNRSKL